MLVLSRKKDQQIVLPELGITLVVKHVHRGRVVLGVQAPLDVPIRRGELPSHKLALSISKESESSLEEKDEMRDITILLATRPSLARNEYRTVLERRGCNVITADDGIRCLELLRESLPDVLVIEPELPWGGGDGVLEVVHQQLELRDVPVVRRCIAYPSPNCPVLPLSRQIQNEPRLRRTIGC